MAETLFDDVVAMFGRAHADAAHGRPEAFARLMRTALVAGTPVIDLAMLTPASGFDAAVIDDASMIRRHDLARALELVATHLETTPSVFRRSVGGHVVAVAARTDDDEVFEDVGTTPPGFRYALVAVDGAAAAFVVAIGHPLGGVDAVLRCPAGPDVVTGVHPGVAELCARIVSACCAA